MSGYEPRKLPPQGWRVPKEMCDQTEKINRLEQENAKLRKVIEVDSADAVEDAERMERYERLREAVEHFRSSRTEGQRESMFAALDACKDHPCESPPPT